MKGYVSPEEVRERDREIMPATRCKDCGKVEFYHRLGCSCSGWEPNIEWGEFVSVYGNLVFKPFPTPRGNEK